MSKLDLAALRGATDTAQEKVGKALDRLDRFDGRIMNGYGIYSDPSEQRRALREAIRHLQEAEAAMAAVRWPTDADYDAHEAAASPSTR